MAAQELPPLHNNSFRGNKGLTYIAGYTYNNDKAIVINSSYKRHLFNLKGEYKINNRIKIGLGGCYTLQDVYGSGVSDLKRHLYNRLRNAVKYRPFLSNAQDIDDSDPMADPNVGNGLIYTTRLRWLTRSTERNLQVRIMLMPHLTITLVKKPDI
ncbi:MAG: hypothetical protein IPM85_00265 [Chitinophagaceae bacterium]|nr:hypothetical protein [Chitinophagaceae bacterium]